MNASDWWQWAAVVILEVVLVAGVAALMAGRLRSPSSQRSVWRCATLVVLGLLFCEVTGVRYAFQRRVEPQGNPHLTSKLVIQTSAILLARPSQGIAVEPLIDASKSISPPMISGSATWWPGAVWMVGALLLLAWHMVCRLVVWRRKREWAAVADSRLNRKVGELAQRLGVERTVSLKASRELRSPIACGLVRPCICVPTDFAEEFSSSQQEVMLAHELAHLAARDVHWYFVTDILAAMLWWHPVVWWMRRRLHAVSELAADDASLLVEGGPGVLAESLVLVARRLTADGSFGRVGIEGNGYRSSLGQRVTRLVDLPQTAWKAPSRSVGWWATGAGVAVLPLVLLVSGEVVDSTSARGGAGWITSPMGAAWTQFSAQDAARSAPKAKPMVLAATPNPVVNRTESLPPPPEKPLSVEAGSQNSFPRKPVADLLEGLSVKSFGPFEAVTLREVVRQLREAVVVNSPGKRGANFLLASDSVADSYVDLKPALQNVSLRSALDRLTNSSSMTLYYSVGATGSGDLMVSFSSEPPRPALVTRSYQLNLWTVGQALGVPGAGGPLSTKPTAGKTNELGGRLMAFLARFGVPMEPPRQLFLNEGNGILLVRASAEDHGLVETALQVISIPPAQLSVEIKFVELPVGEAKRMGLDSLLRTNLADVTARAVPSSAIRPVLPIGMAQFQTSSNIPPASTTAILTPRQFRDAMTQFQKAAGVEILSAPTVTTLSGRPTQVKSVNVRYVVTDLDVDAKQNIQPISTPFESGPVLDVVPYVGGDGYSIQMTLIPTVKEFLGYDLQKTSPFSRTVGNASQPMPQPIFRVLQVIANAVALDGYTVVVSPGTAEVEDRKDPAPPGSRKTVRRDLMIFVTPTLIDPAGNRLHSEAEVAQAALGLGPGEGGGRPR